jgi:cytoskeletal protein CcmA (bactofilin family)
MLEMFGKRKKIKASKIDSLIGRQTEIFGDLRFSGWLHVDGTVKGNVVADDDSSSVLTLSEHGTIEGEVRVPNVVLNGVVIGDVHADVQIELAANAQVTGNVYYQLIEMAMGAEVNGNLVHRGELPEKEPRRLEPGPTLKMAEET